jgi:hypothetical protein
MNGTLGDTMCETTILGISVRDDMSKGPGYGGTT